MVEIVQLRKPIVVCTEFCTNLLYIASHLNDGGKMMEDIVGRETVDHLPTLISGEGIDQLLAVPKLSSGKGEATVCTI